MKYGLNYQGSKNPIVAELCDMFPVKTNFYDLFAGGGAVTHRMLELGEFKNYIISDINPMPLHLFVDSVMGNIEEPRWVSHEEFNENKGTDPYAGCLFCFGGDWNSYAYGEEIEPIKRALHNAVVNCDYTEAKELGFNLEGLEQYRTWQERRMRVKDYLPEQYKSFQIEHLQRLIHLERLSQMGDITFEKKTFSLTPLYGVSYDKVDIASDSVVYCDPPYRNTKGYVAKGFDHEKFYDWCRTQTELTFISEYTMPDDFTCIKEFNRLEAKSAYTASTVIERLFIPNHLVDLYDQDKTTLF